MWRGSADEAHTMKRYRAACGGKSAPTIWSQGCIELLLNHLKSARYTNSNKGLQTLYSQVDPSHASIPQALDFMLVPLVAVEHSTGPRARMVLTGALASVRGMLVRLRSGERTVRPAPIYGPGYPTTAVPLDSFLSVHQELARLTLDRRVPRGCSWCRPGYVRTGHAAPLCDRGRRMVAQATVPVS